ncbi:MAG: TetR/AcrR family transcriptional regulator [Actinomycetota bacterium]
MSTRERLLQTALAVFAEHGTDGGSMREIARRAGVNVATAYHHFGSKREMFLAIFQELGFLDRPEDTSWITPDMEPAEVLESLCLGAWVLMSGGADVLRLAIAELMKGDSEVRSVFEAWREQGDKYLRDALVQGRLATEGNAERRAWVLRQVIWATFISELLAEGFAAEELQRRARDTATTLLEGGWR